ncbi:MAG: hypothetical protein IT313_11645, partial [Anaerolineales bacterium]|nr:hypothetical protein [Anaerolineales bacterium]
MVDKIQNNPFNRPPRIQDKFKPEEIDIPVPSLKPEETARNVLLMLLPMGSFLVMGLFYALTFSVGSAGRGWLYAIPMLGMALFTFVASFMTYGEQKHEQKQRWIKQQRDYHRLLDKKESRLIAGQSLQHSLLTHRFPSPSRLMLRVKNLQVDLWERRVEDADFLTFRLGEGNVPSAIPIKRPDPDNSSADIRRAYRIYAKYRTIPNAPVTIDLRELGSIALVGNRDNILPMSRAMLVQLATLNSPDDVSLYVFSSQSQYRTWKWLRWLPHTSEENVGGHPTFLAFTRRTNKQLITEISKNLDAMRQSRKEQEVVSSQLSAPAIVALFDDEIDVRDEQVFHEILKNGHALGIFSILICERLEDVPSNCRAIIEFSKQGVF